MKKLPSITFGMIVLNGEPFVRYNLRALYPFAHQIIVVEGVCSDDGRLRLFLWARETRRCKPRPSGEAAFPREGLFGRSACQVGK